MTIAVLVAIIVILAATNLALWKFGFVHDAIEPKLVVDKPVIDPKERRAVKKRLARWREEGKLNREEFEHWTRLCEEEWDG